MPDERDGVLRALAPGGLVGSMSGLAKKMAIEALPADLTLHTATDRLIQVLDEMGQRRVLRQLADKHGFALSRSSKLPDPLGVVEKALAESDKVTLALRDYLDAVERDGQAVIARGSDPGATQTTARCATCSVPLVVSAGVLKLEAAGRTWVVVVTAS